VSEITCVCQYIATPSTELRHQVEEGNVPDSRDPPIGIRRETAAFHPQRPEAARPLPTRSARGLTGFWSDRPKAADRSPPIPTLFAKDTIPIINPVTFADTLSGAGRKHALHHRL
jgi:hypothetical protein